MNHKRFKPEVDYSNEYVGENGEFDPTKDVNHDNSKIKLKVPVEFRGYEIPRDIQNFITGIYPNIFIAVKNSLYNYTEVSNSIKNEYALEIIGNGIMYILGNDKTGIKRYLKYDNKKYSKIPYYRWFISQILFWVKTFKVRHYEEQKIQNATQSFELLAEDSHQSEKQNDRIMSKALESNPVASRFSNGFEVYALKETLNKESDLNFQVTDLSAYELYEINDNVRVIREEIEKFNNSIKLSEFKSSYSNILQVFDYLMEGLEIKQMASELKSNKQLILNNIEKIKQILAINFPNLRNQLIRIVAH